MVATLLQQAGTLVMNVNGKNWLRGGDNGTIGNCVLSGIYSLNRRGQKTSGNYRWTFFVSTDYKLGVKLGTHKRVS